MPRTGRPTNYTPEIAAKVCDLIAQGYFLRAIGEIDGMPAKRTVLQWLHRHEDFAHLYARAREAQADHMAEEILDIADDGSNDWMEREGVTLPDHEHMQRSRLRVDTRKWLMAKLQPRKWGEKQQLTGDGGGPVMVVTGVLRSDDKTTED